MLAGQARLPRRQRDAGRAVLPKPREPQRCVTPPPLAATRPYSSPGSIGTWVHSHCRLQVALTAMSSLHVCATLRHPLPVYPLPCSTVVTLLPPVHSGFAALFQTDELHVSVGRGACRGQRASRPSAFHCFRFCTKTRSIIHPTPISRLISPTPISIRDHVRSVAHSLALALTHRDPSGRYDVGVHVCGRQG